MTYADRNLTCVDCGSMFIHSADDQQYYAEKGFASDPKRCVSCRASRRATRDGGSAPASAARAGPVSGPDKRMIAMAACPGAVAGA